MIPVSDRDHGGPRFTNWLEPAQAHAAGAFVLGLVLLLISAGALNAILSNLFESRTLVLRTSTILREMEGVHVDLRAAETGQRGFLLTGERQYLAPYDLASERVWTRYDGLLRLVQDRGQRDRLSGLRPLMTAKLEELAHTVALRRESLDAALAVVRTDVGQRLTDQIEVLIGDFQATEQRILVAGTSDLDRQSQIAAVAAGITGLMSLASTVAGLVWISRQRGQTRVLQAEKRFRTDLEQQVERRTAELRDANRDLDAFAYTISHDLRAPLRAMHGYAEALSEDFGPSLPEEGQRYTSRIVVAADQMDLLIRDILTYSRLAREDVSLRPTSLDNLVDEVLQRTELGIASGAGASIEVKRPLHDVLAHGPILRQVVDNLLSNALKFVPMGEAAKVCVSSERRDGNVRLWIEDAGIGIAPEHRDRIFRPFERLHGVESYPGTGIGLAIVQRSLERMNGSCGVLSEVGEGSRFWIELAAAERTG